MVLWCSPKENQALWISPARRRCYSIWIQKERASTRWENIQTSLLLGLVRSREHDRGASGERRTCQGHRTHSTTFLHRIPGRSRTPIGDDFQSPMPFASVPQGRLTDQTATEELPRLPINDLADALRSATEGTRCCADVSFTRLTGALTSLLTSGSLPPSGSTLFAMTTEGNGSIEEGGDEDPVFKCSSLAVSYHNPIVNRFDYRTPSRK